MKILVTGSNGLLGQKLTGLFLTKPQINLVATARGQNKYHQTKAYTYAELDITNEQQVHNTLAAHKPDVVINTAALTNVDACELDNNTCHKLNVQAVKYLVDACNANHIHLVHLSTDFIFDGTHGPLTEEDKPNPISYYGLSKLKAEQIIINNCDSWAIARTVLVYGVVSDMSRSNIVLWAKNNLQQGKPIQVVYDQFRTPTLAEDLANGCFLIASQKANGIYHISGNEFMSVFDLVYQIADFFNLNKQLISMSSSASINQPAKRPPITGFNTAKAYAQLGFKPHTFLQVLQLVQSQLLSQTS